MVRLNSLAGLKGCRVLRRPNVSQPPYVLVRHVLLFPLITWKYMSLRCVQFAVPLCVLWLLYSRVARISYLTADVAAAVTAPALLQPPPGPSLHVSRGRFKTHASYVTQLENVSLI